jgi:HEAT repeat protein
MNIDDDWISTELPKVLGEFGQTALEPVSSYLADPTHDEWARESAAEALGKIGERHTELRTECVARLIDQLEKFAEQSPTLNAFLVSPLLELKAVEALPVIERAFAADQVDETVAGDFEDAEIALGLKTQRQHPREPNELTAMGKRLRALAGDKLVDGIMGGADGAIPTATVRNPPKIGRNDPCPCGSGKKFKKCCGSA